MMTLRNYQPVSLKAIKKLLDGKLETKVQLDLGDFKESVRAEFEGMGPRVTGTENQVAPTCRHYEACGSFRARDWQTNYTPPRHESMSRNPRFVSMVVGNILGASSLEDAIS